MAGTTFLFNEGAYRILQKFFDNETIQAALLMTNTTVDTENDGIALIGDFTTLDEFDGAGYARKTLGTKVTTKDDTNDRAWSDAADLTWTAQAAGTRDVDGLLLIWVDGANYRPLTYHQYETPRSPDGTDFVVEFRADTGLWVMQKG